MKIRNLLALCCALVYQSQTCAAVSDEEALALNGELTPMGAVRSGNANGTIPQWNPELNFSSSDPIYITNPLSDEQPLFSITKDNMDQYSDKLSEGSKALLLNKEDFRMDVYPTIRSALAPEFIYKNSIANATQTKLSNDGLTLNNWQPGVPFPIPKNGLELIWNHLTRWSGKHSESTSTVYYVSTKGKLIEASTQFVSYLSPVYSPELDWGKSPHLFLLRANFLAPARRAGEITLVREPYDFSEGKGREAWQYLTGQRRVRRAPSVSFDTPAPATAGNSTYDDTGIFNGSPERFDWKLVGRQECYMPYNNWRTTNVEEPETLMPAGHLRNDAIRWELHRCWIVEADRKKEVRHIYSKRRYYIDEDSWTAVMGDLYDGRDELWRANFSLFAPDYMSQSFSSAGGSVMYDFKSGIYNVGLPRPYSVTSKKKPKKPRYYTSSALKRSGVR